MRTFALSLLAFAFAVPTLPAQPPAPPRPENYKVTLRYHIPATRDQHVLQYDAMIRHLQRIGFTFDPPLETHPNTDREDRSKNYLHGSIATGNIRKILDSPVVQTMQLIPLAPVEFKLPDAPDDPVSVRLEMAGNLPADRQRELMNQTRVLLRELGFKEAPGYDHRGYTQRIYTRLVGTIPRKNLDLLGRDLRSQPAGWLGPIIPRAELPLPLREMNPVQVVEVLPDTEAIKELAEHEPRLPDYLEKLSPDLWQLVKMKDVPPTPIRVQIGLVGNPRSDDGEWKKLTLEETPGFFLEGQLGQFVTGIIRLDKVKPLASSPLVSLIRLPRTPSAEVDPGIKIKGDNAKALEQAGLKELHARGYKGKGVRIAIVDRDFRRWEDLVKSKQLPASTRIVDLTTERNFEAYPERYAGPANQFGHGTLCAQAAALAAPDAEFVLVRVDVHDPYQLGDVARYVQGGRFSSLVERRSGELSTRAAQLQTRRTELLREREPILNDFTDETDLKASLGFLGPFYEWLYSNREWHLKRMEFHENLETEQRQREQRFRRFLDDINSLQGIPIVVNALSWNSGYPLGSASPLSKLLDDPKGPLWFQSVGNTRGQNWMGLYRNIPGDQAMKFADDDEPLPKGRWSNDINFLAWQPYAGDAKPDLPAKLKLRLTMQWREPHDPDFYLRPDEEDAYRRPLAGLTMQLLHQRDAETKRLPADAFELTAQTKGWPQRLEHLPGSSVYEHVLEVPLASAGRYALRVEKQASSQWSFVPHPVRRTFSFNYVAGLAPTGIRPLGTPSLPALETAWELRTRIFVEVLDDANRIKGRAVFADFPTETGAIGIPADARNVVSVGAASLQNKPQPYSAFGSPAGMELGRRPWLYAYDELELAAGGAFGTSVANAFAAGTTAAMMSGSLSREEIIQMLRAQDGQVLHAPVRKK
jgi:hypothetical protein